MASRSRDALASRRSLDLAGVQTASADLDLLDLAIELDTDDLKIRLPGAAGLVVRVRHVVAKGDAFAAGVADVALNGHGQVSTSSIRAISAPSPLRCPVLRMRV